MSFKKFKLKQMSLAKYECHNDRCKYVFEAKAGYNKCIKCKNKYVKWTNYNETFGKLSLTEIEKLSI